MEIRQQYNKISKKYIILKFSFATSILLFSHVFFPVLATNLEKPIIKEEKETIFTTPLDIDYFKKFSIIDYIVGSGDTLFIKVSPDYPELNALVTVDGEGTIIVGPIGRIFVRDLSVPELTKLLNKSFKKYIKFPAVEITITNYRPVNVIVDGEVNNPGIHTLRGSMSLNNASSNSQKYNQLSIPQASFKRNKIESNPESFAITSAIKLENQNINYYFPTVFDAIRIGGGITRYSDLSSVKIVRKNTISSGGGKITTSLNFEDTMLKGDNSENIRIYDGDLIFIEKMEKSNEKIISSAIKSNLNPKYISVYVTGRVREPGLITLGKSSTLNDAIDVAGGTRVLKGPVKYISFNNDGTIKKNEIRYRKNRKRGSKNNPYLREGDLIYVGSTLLSNSAEVINEVTQPFQGLYSAYRLIDLLSD